MLIRSLPSGRKLVGGWSLKLKNENDDPLEYQIRCNFSCRVLSLRHGDGDAVLGVSKPYANPSPRLHTTEANQPPGATAEPQRSAL